MIKRLIKVPLKIFSVWGSTQIAALILGVLFFMVIGCGGSEFEKSIKLSDETMAGLQPSTTGGTFVTHGGTPVVPEGFQYIGPYTSGADAGSFPSHVWNGERPTKFNESPLMAQYVAAGKLPPLEERLPVPEDVFVERPMEEIGIYGGTYRTASGYLAAIQVQADTWCQKPDTDGLTMIPWICKSIDQSEDGKKYTYTLRKGHKWSDGEPLNTESVRFAWEELNFNEEYVPFINTRYRDPVTNNKLRIDIIDDVTWTFTFDTAVYDFNETRSADADCIDFCMWTNVKYTSRYHPKYSEKKWLDQQLKNGNFNDWTELMRRQQDVRRIVDYPWIGAYKVCEASERRRTICRNPYFHAVDPAGNQLPYTDSWTDVFFESREVAMFRSMAGESDMSSAGTTLMELPLYKANMEKGDYSILGWPQLDGTAPISFNQTFNDDPEIGELVRTKDFRVALSLAINREELLNGFFIGIGTIRNGAPSPDDPYLRHQPELENLYMERDLEKSNQLLDGLGLIDTDGDGLRNRRDGRGNLVLYTGGSKLYSPYLNVIVKNWKEVGILLRWKEEARYSRVVRANKGYLSMGSGCGHGWAGSPGFPPMNWWSHCGPEIGKYNASKGRSGMAPGPDPSYKPLAPPDTYPADPTGDIMKFEKLHKEGRAYPMHHPRRIEIGKEIWRTIVEDQYLISTVSYAPLDRKIYIKRNNFRNVPVKSNARGFYGGWPEVYYFEGGLDNINHQGNRSQKYKSYSFR